MRCLCWYDWSKENQFLSIRQSSAHPVIWSAYAISSISNTARNVQWRTKKQRGLSSGSLKSPGVQGLECPLVLFVWPVERWHQVNVVIPELPGFAGDVKNDTALKTIMTAQYRTINRGGRSIYGKLVLSRELWLLCLSFALNVLGWISFGFNTRVPMTGSMLRASYISWQCSLFLTRLNRIVNITPQRSHSTRRKRSEMRISFVFVAYRCALHEEAK